MVRCLPRTAAPDLPLANLAPEFRPLVAVLSHLRQRNATDDLMPTCQPWQRADAISHDAGVAYQVPTGVCVFEQLEHGFGN